MTQFPSRESIQADFHGVVLTNESMRFTLSQTNDQFWVRMERAALQDTGQVEVQALDTRIGLVTGSHHMQVFWVPAGGEGNGQLGFPFTWLIPERRWVPRKSTFIRPPEAPHLSEVWNLVCCRCHTTGVEPRIDSGRRVADTQVAELGISCEACHGPGEQHVQARLAQRDAGEVEPAVLEREIVHPRKLDPVRSAQICGFCHSMKWLDNENWRQNGFRFRPGDNLEETTPIIRPGKVQDIPGLAEYLERHPDLLRDFFWPDGMVRVSGRDYNGLLESPCYKGGQFSCLSCHSSHRSEPANQLARNRLGDDACLQCHDAFSSEPARAAHTRHQAGSSGSECYNCHMPRTTYGVLKAIRSHQISSPSVTDQLTTGRPNACNLCHLDKSLAWTAEHLTRWHGHATPQLGEEERGISDAVRLGLAGDAGQRALVAWHLGWAPAREVSSGSWMAPVLAQLLDDPYAAVRCIAERSLKQFTDLVPPDYDYSHEPEAREEVGSQVILRWQAQGVSHAPAETLVRPQDLPAMRADFQQLIQRRNNQPLRLRE